MIAGSVAAAQRVRGLDTLEDARYIPGLRALVFRPSASFPELATLRTLSAKPAEIQRRWYVVDAAGQPLGRLASRIATVLRGKHTPRYTPHVDTGDFVIVVNADKVKLTGAKLDKKFYYKHSGIPGGFRAEAYRSLLGRKPAFALEKAVKGMLPKTPLGRKMHGKLKVYAGPTHPHAAQKPQALVL